MPPEQSFLEQGFLRALGARLREQRARRGQSLSEVSREAGLSRRYLTEAEAGRANPSALVLLRLTAVLGVSLGDLLDTALSRPARERVALVGLRGAGKTSVGRLLAQALEAPFVELDEEVERLAGLGLGEIFDLHGAAGFHRFEAEALERVLASAERIVIATGGSIVSAPRTYERLLATCRCVWLSAAPEQHFQRVLDQGDRRPMQDRPGAMQELQALLEERGPAYARCELSVPTDEREAAEVAALVVDALRLG